MTVKVYQAISNVSKALLSGIAKNTTNQQQGWRYRGVDDVMNALAKNLTENGLLIIPQVIERTCEERRTDRGKPIFYVTVTMDFEFICVEDGSTKTVRMVGEGMDSGDKATNKAMSIAYKYAALQTFCIPTEETSIDPDAQVHTLEAKGAGGHQQNAINRNQRGSGQNQPATPATAQKQRQQQAQDVQTQQAGPTMTREQQKEQHRKNRMKQEAIKLQKSHPGNPAGLVNDVIDKFSSARNVKELECWFGAAYMALDSANEERARLMEVYSVFKIELGGMTEAIKNA